MSLDTLYTLADKFIASESWDTRRKLQEAMSRYQSETREDCGPSLRAYVRNGMLAKLEEEDTAGR